MALGIPGNRSGNGRGCLTRGNRMAVCATSNDDYGGRITRRNRVAVSGPYPYDLRDSSTRRDRMAGSRPEIDNTGGGRPAVRYRMAPSRYELDRLAGCLPRRDGPTVRGSKVDERAEYLAGRHRVALRRRANDPDDR